MRYRLVVLTHGQAPTLERTIDSFYGHVTPLPTERILVSDGPCLEAAGIRWDEILESGSAEGFCTATRRTWATGAASDADYVFYLENDFEFTRSVDLRELAMVIDAEPQLAQMALMRDAVNETEKLAGGLYESRPGQYRHRYLNTETGVSVEMPDPNPVTQVTRCRPWLEHKAYLTTNPSLMRREFMAKNPWPDHSEFCEGKFGIDLLTRGYRFGAWGSGEPWVRHIGVRDGFGY